MSGTRDDTAPGGTAPGSTEKRLQDALEALAGEVHAAPGAYRAARGAWLRRERKRRLVLAVLIAVIFTLAILIGLWVLNRAPSQPGAVFNHAATVTSQQALPRGLPGRW